MKYSIPLRELFLKLLRFTGVQPEIFILIIFFHIEEKWVIL